MNVLIKCNSTSRLDNIGQYFVPKTTNHDIHQNKTLSRYLWTNPFSILCICVEFNPINRWSRLWEEWLMHKSWNCIHQTFYLKWFKLCWKLIYTFERRCEFLRIHSIEAILKVYIENNNLLIRSFSFWFILKWYYFLYLI